MTTATARDSSLGFYEWLPANPIPLDCERVHVDVREIPEGDAGIRITVGIMVEITRAAMRHPTVRRYAEAAVARISHADPEAEVDAVAEWILARVDYRPDPIVTEWLQTPWYLLQCKVGRGERPQADCDDLAMLSLGMLGNIGYAGQFHVAATQPDGVYDHVYGLVQLPRGWEALDLTRPGGPRVEYRAEDVPV